MRLSALLFFVGWIALTAASQGEEPQLHVRSLPIGGQSVEVVSRSTRDSGTRWLLVNVHDDENTSVEAASSMLTRFPCRMVELRHSGKREVAFSISGQDYLCDPNRIFTPAGVRATLEKLSTHADEAQREVERFGKSLVQIYALDKVQSVVALHNNTEDRYSASSYLPGAEYESEAAAVKIHPDSDPDDFFFVTERVFFDSLSTRGFNVVLQDNRAMTDDGSLSVYCAQQGIPYVNVEAQHGHLKVQIEMLEALFGMLEAECKLELVNLKSVNVDWIIDSPYATAGNVAKVALYPKNELFLERSAVDRLARVQRALQKRKLCLKILDAYRPLSVQKKLWSVLPDPRYVADPAKGSRHNRGSAVDVTLVDMDGKELEMPTKFDEFTEKAHHDFADLPLPALRNRQLLLEAMEAEGFERLDTEWWHYDAPGWKRFSVSDVDPWGE